MGQYYKAYVKNDKEKVYNAQNAMYLTVMGLESSDRLTDGYKVEGFWGYFSGIKLTEHSWTVNDFCNGVIEQIWDKPSKVAWVGDYANEPNDFNDAYTEAVYETVWGNYRKNKEAIPSSPFSYAPHIHEAGWLINHTKGVYLCLSDYVIVSSEPPRSGGYRWCLHPLPLLTCIGNGRGGGDYHGTNMGKVGSWAMDEIEYTLDIDKLKDFSALAARDYRFIEGKEQW